MHGNASPGVAGAPPPASPGHALARAPPYAPPQRKQRPQSPVRAACLLQRSGCFPGPSKATATPAFTSEERAIQCRTRVLDAEKLGFSERCSEPTGREAAPMSVRSEQWVPPFRAC